MQEYLHHEEILVGRQIQRYICLGKKDERKINEFPSRRVNRPRIPRLLGYSLGQRYLT